MATAIKQLRRFGALELGTKTALQQQTWNEDDFSLALGALNRYPNDALAHTMLRKIEQQSNIISLPTFPQLMQFAIKSQRRVSPGVVSTWGEHLAQTSNFSMLNLLLVRIGSHSTPVSMLKVLEKRLLSDSVTVTSTEVANLIVNLTKTKYQFQAECYETLLSAAAKLWFPSRELSLLVYSMIKTTLSPLTSARYLSYFSGQIESKLLTMAAQDRARFLCAYTSTWTEISPKIIRAVMRDADLSILEDGEIANILTVLAQKPIRGDEAVFQAAEELFLEYNYVPMFILASLTHSFQRRNQGSQEFWDFVNRFILEDKSKYHPCGAFLLYRKAEIGSKQRDVLELELRKRLQVRGSLASGMKVLLDAGDLAAAEELKRLAEDWGYNG